MQATDNYVWIATVNPFWWGLVMLLALLIGFVPSFIAFRRHHPSRMAILVLNVFLGWTGIGWLVLLIWSLERPARFA